MGDPLDDVAWPEPDIDTPVPAPPDPPPLDTRYKDTPVDKKAILQWLREQLTEENTDKLIQTIGDLARPALPDVPVDVAEKILDLALPGLLLAALDRVLD